MNDLSNNVKDLWGEAIHDHHFSGCDEVLMTKTNISEGENMKVSYLFRSFDQMPALEQLALSKACGKVLDVGCGAGSHALYLQNERHIEVTAIDISAKAIEVCLDRGIKSVNCESVFNYYPTDEFDTILLLMNGTGICGTLSNLESFLLKLKSLLKIGGQILVESSDLQYMYRKGELLDLRKTGKYYGELKFSMKYKDDSAPDFDWLYVDFKLLKSYCRRIDLDCENIHQGDDDEFLARLTKTKF